MNVIRKLENFESKRTVVGFEEFGGGAGREEQVELEVAVALQSEAESLRGASVQRVQRAESSSPSERQRSALLLSTLSPPENVLGEPAGTGTDVREVEHIARGQFCRLAP